MMFPKPPKPEKKKPKPLKSKKPLERSTKPIKHRSSKRNQIESKRTTLTGGCCWVCQATENLAPHEIYFGRKNRWLSIIHGMVVDMCLKHHTEKPEGVHHNAALDAKLKAWGQREFQKIHPDKDFISIFGKNYL